MAIGQENKDEGRKDFTLYDFMERGADSKYPSWTDGAPNLQTYLNALNKSQPIIGCQFELVWSRWPRTLFFSKNITIPGVSVNTLDLSHAGFTVKIPTHVTYETTEITLNIIADKEGFHYYDLRNMVMQTGHPLVAGDPMSTIGNPYGISPDEDTIEVRLRNKPDDKTHHHWIIHNFKPTGIGDLELSVDGASFVEFELKGTFTHITYDCGFTAPPEEEPTPSPEDKPQEEPQPSEEEEPNSEEPTPEEPQDGYEDYVEETVEAVNEDVMSGSRYSISNDNCKIFVETLSDVKLLPQDSETPVSQEEIDLAKECSQELTNAADELKAEMEKISQMPADPNYNPEDGKVVDEDLMREKTPKEGQEGKTDKVVASVQSDCQFKSAEQKAAYDAAMAKYQDSTKKAMSSYKDKKAQLGS